MQYEVNIRQTIEYMRKFEAESFNEAAELALKSAKAGIPKIERVLNIDGFNDHDTNVSAIFAEYNGE